MHYFHKHQNNLDNFLNYLYEILSIKAYVIYFYITIKNSAFLGVVINDALASNTIKCILYFSNINLFIKRKKIINSLKINKNTI